MWEYEKLETIIGIIQFPYEKTMGNMGPVNRIRDMM
jgi:hypothetical protein